MLISLTKVLLIGRRNPEPNRKAAEEMRGQRAAWISAATGWVGDKAFLHIRWGPEPI